MSKRILLLLCALSLLCGCARHYVITLSNGTRIGTRSKPRLQDGFYVFKDASGQQVTVSRGRVTEIAPASMAAESSSYFNPAPQK